MHILSALIVGLVFGIGLIVSGMTDPSKVLGFLDLAGPWDPSLAFVMGGAILVGLLAFRVAGAGLAGERQRQASRVHGRDGGRHGGVRIVRADGRRPRRRQGLRRTP